MKLRILFRNVTIYINKGFQSNFLSLLSIILYVKSQNHQLHNYINDILYFLLQNSEDKQKLIYIDYILENHND